MVLYSSYDGVPLKFKKEKGRASSLPAGIIWAYYDPSWNSLDNTFKGSVRLSSTIK